MSKTVVLSLLLGLGLSVAVPVARAQAPVKKSAKTPVTAPAFPEDVASISSPLLLRNSDIAVVTAIS